MQASQLTLFSIGIAAENKPLDTRKLNVTPIESLPAIDGEINYSPTEHTSVGYDEEGNRYEVKATTDVSLTAEWMPGGTNRVTPPDIRRGELVEIWQVGDSDQYLWRCMGLRDDLRRLETVIFAFNASPNENSPGIDVSTCYFLEVSAHKKLVTFATSQANGEPFGYTMQFNTGSGQVTLEDTIGNSLHLDSGKVFWEMINSDGTLLQLDRKSIYAKADENIELRAGNDIYAEAGKNVTIKAGANFLAKAGATALVDGGSSAGLKSGGSSFTLKPGGTTLVTPKFEGGT